MLALPLKQLSVIRSTAKINYQPPLPSQRDHLTQNMAPGHLIKFVITYGTVSNAAILYVYSIHNEHCMYTDTLSLSLSLSVSLSMSLSLDRKSVV